MATYVIPYACGFDKDDLPDTTGKARCDLALKVAKEIPDAIILLGAAMPEYSNSKAITLADSMARYLEQQGWPRERILINAKGYETVSETAAVNEWIESLGEGKITVVSSWYHVPRIKIIWQIVFGKRVKGRSVKHRIKPRALAKNILAIAYSIWKAWQWRRKQASFEDLQKDVLRRNPPKARLI